MSPRRSNGEGSKPRKRRDGRFEAKIWVEYPDGERKRVTAYGSTASECRDRILVLRTEARGGTLTKPNPETVAAFLDRWLTDVVVPSSSRGTARSYGGIIRTTIAPAIGMKRLQQLTPAEVQHMVAGAPDAPGARSRELAYVVLKAALKRALKWGLVTRNVCDAVEKPRVKKRAVTFFTPIEVEQLFRAAESDRLRAIYPLFVFTGVRPGEAFALRWTDVNLDAATITVTSTLDPESRLAGETKSASGRRTIDMPPRLVAELRAHRERMKAESRIDPHVFTQTTGGALSARNFARDHWKPLLVRAWGGEAKAAPTKARLNRIRIVPTRDRRLYDTRHTAATLMIAAGVHVKVISERMGHASVAFTMDVYGHLLPTMGASAAAALELLMPPGQSRIG